MVREAEVQAAIQDYLDAIDVLHWRVCVAAIPARTSVGGRRWRKNKLKGHPDLAGVREGGRYFAIEVKRPGAEANLSPEQLTWKADLERRGVLYVVASSVEDVRRAFQGAVGA